MEELRAQFASLALRYDWARIASAASAAGKAVEPPVARPRRHVVVIDSESDEESGGNAPVIPGVTGTAESGATGCSVRRLWHSLRGEPATPAGGSASPDGAESDADDSSLGSEDDTGEDVGFDGESCGGTSDDAGDSDCSSVLADDDDAECSDDGSSESSGGGSSDDSRSGSGGSASWRSFLPAGKESLHLTRYRDAATAALFRLFNSRVFGGGLPSDMAVTWNKRLTRTAGLTYSRRATAAATASGAGAGADAEPSAGAGGGSSLALVRISRIELSVKVVDSAEKLAATLLHEMCHAAAWVIDGVSKPPHGAVFWKWGAVATRCYPDLRVTTCHAYTIVCRYQYRCLTCGHIYGRHSKSIDVTRQRCGKLECGGELRLREDVAGAGTPSARKPPATPSAYTLFVKRERSRIAAELPPGTTPQQVLAAVARVWQAQKGASAAAAAPAAVAASGDACGAGL